MVNSICTVCMLIFYCHMVQCTLQRHARLHYTSFCLRPQQSLEFMNTVRTCGGVLLPNRCPCGLPDENGLRRSMGLCKCLLVKTVLTLKGLGTGTKEGQACRAFSSAWISKATRLNQSAADRQLAAWRGRRCSQGSSNFGQRAEVQSAC